MEWFNSVVSILANPWVSWSLTILCGIIGAIFKIQLNGIKTIATEVFHSASVYLKATDPKGPAGKDWTDEERNKFGEELSQLGTAIGVVIKK